MNYSPLVSIVTICYNSEKFIQKTINSVLTQDFINFEYIIIDGASTDNTLDLIKEYLPLFEKKGIIVTLLSEADNGIYNAMNKGIDLAAGKWINFMNSGDCFQNDKVLNNIFEQEYPYDILCGSAEIVLNGKKSLWNPKDLTSIWKRMPFCHQSVFVRRAIHSTQKFDERYRLSADYDFFLRAYISKEKFHYIDICVAKYDTEGQSVTNETLSALENIRIALKHHHLRAFIFHSLVYAYRSSLKKFIKK